MDTLVGRFVGPFVGSPRLAETGKRTFVSTLVGSVVGALHGRLRGPIRGHTRGVKFRSLCALCLQEDWPLVAHPLDNLRRTRWCSITLSRSFSASLSLRWPGDSQRKYPDSRESIRTASSIFITCK